MVHLWYITGIQNLLPTKGISMPANSTKRITNIEKDNRKFWLSHEAFLLLQELASQKGIDSAAFLEVHLRDLAEERLTATQREEIHAQAQQISARRREAASQEHP